MLKVYYKISSRQIFAEFEKCVAATKRIELEHEREVQ